MINISRAVLQILNHLGIGHVQACLGQKCFFFRNSPNGSIHKVKWLKTESEHLLQNLPTTGGHRLSLRNFSAKNEIKVLIHFIDFVWFDLSDNAYSVR